MGISDALREKDDQINTLAGENLRLKWIIGQMMQRWSKDGYAIFYTVNKDRIGLQVTENLGRKQIEVRIKVTKSDEQTTNELPETDREVNLN